MKFAVRTSTALSPIVNRMRALTRRATEFLAATAFLSPQAVADVLESGLTAGSRIRLLTGTFGHQTRKSVFKRLLSMSSVRGLRVRIWDCGRHGNLHAKIYLWRLPGHAGVAWIGSPNLTVGGLQAEGEVVFEVRQPWDGSVLTVIRDAFEAEWQRSRALDRAFVRDYQESKRVAPDLRLARRRHGLMPRVPTERTLLLTVSEHYGDESRVVKRVEQQLEGDYDNFVIHGARQVSGLRTGDKCLVVDRIDETITPGRVVDTARYGRRWAFAYENLLPGDGDVPLTKHTLDRLARAGLSLAYPGPIRKVWLGPDRMRAVLAVLRKVSIG